MKRTGNSKIAVVGWGRGMGHKGHMYLADAVITQATNMKADPYFFVSKTVGKDDPVFPEEKVRIYQKVFPQYAPIFTPEGNLNQALQELAQLGYQGVVVVVGADQKKAFQYLEGNNKEGVPVYQSLGLKKLRVISRQETNSKFANEEGPRATPMREILLNPDASEEDKFEVWRRDMPEELSDREVLDIMNKAESRLVHSNAPKVLSQMSKKAAKLKEAIMSFKVKKSEEQSEKDTEPFGYKHLFKQPGEPEQKPVEKHYHGWEEYEKEQNPDAVEEGRIIDANAKVDLYYVTPKGARQKIFQAIPQRMLDKAIAVLQSKYPNINPNDIEMRPAGHGEYTRTEGVAEEGFTKTPSGDYINQHTGVRSSKPPVKKKRGEKTGAEWDAIEKAKKDKEQGVVNEFAIDKPDDGDGRSKLISSIVRLLQAGNRVDFFVPGIRGHVVGAGSDGQSLRLKRWKKPYSKVNYSLALDSSDDARFVLKMINPDYYQVVEKTALNEFAPDDSGDSGQEDMFFKYAKMWYNGNLKVQQKVEEILAQAGWEIGPLESEEGGAFIVQSGDENGDTYMGWSAEELQGLDESALKDKQDLDAKRQALQQMEREPGHDKEAIRQRKLDLDKEARAKGLGEAGITRDKEQRVNHHKLDEFAPGNGDDDSERYVPPNFGKPYKSRYLRNNQFDIWCETVPNTPSKDIQLKVTVDKSGLDWDGRYWYIDSPGGVHLKWKYGDIPLPGALDQAGNPGHIHDLISDFLNKNRLGDLQDVAKYYGFTDGEMNEDYLPEK